MTNQEIENTLGELVKQERQTTNRILELINLAELRKIHLERGYSSLFEWLVKAFGYSESAAYRRISAARLLREVPETAAKIESGALNLTTLAKAQSAFRAQEKISGEKLSSAKRAEVLQLIENKSSTQVDSQLLGLFPDTERPDKEKIKLVNENTSSLTVHLRREDIENLDWIKAHFSHALPGASTGEILSRVLKEFRTFAAKKGRVRRCEYVDPKTGKRCNSTHLSQTDHIRPKALGGTNEPTNLRSLCRSHNLLMAEKKLGQRWANAWRATKVRHQEDLGRR